MDVTSQRQENRLRIKEEYYSFRDRSTFTYVAWPTALLYLNRERQKGLEAGAANTWFSLVTVFPVLVQFYWCWMLYFYAALALRENVLRCNGSRIRRWWINHHYYSMGMCLVVLTMDVQSNACLNYMSRFLVFTALQGVVMLTQNRYQRFRMYTRVAMGKASPMDVAGGEMGGNAGQLKLLYPLLFGLQIMQVYFGASVLVSVARSTTCWTASGRFTSASGSCAWVTPQRLASWAGSFSASGRRPPRVRCSSSWAWVTSGPRARPTSPSASSPRSPRGQRLRRRECCSECCVWVAPSSDLDQ